MIALQVIYGMDPLCGWCFGIGPALSRVMADHLEVTVVPVLGGLVTGERVGPYAAMEGYVRQASVRLEAVTGRAPSPAFFEMIRRPGVTGDSAPPSVAIAAMRAAQPDRLAEFALRLTEAHFTDGADYGDPATYDHIATAMGLPPLALTPADLSDPGPAQAEWAMGRAQGLNSYPTLWLRHSEGLAYLPLTYDPAELSAVVGRAKVA